MKGFINKSLSIALLAVLLVSSAIQFLPVSPVMAADPYADKVVPANEQPKDPQLLKALQNRGVDTKYVRLMAGYDLESGGGNSPYAQTWIDQSTGKRFTEISQLPMVDANGDRVEVGWFGSTGSYQGKNNVFIVEAKNNRITLTAENNQADGRKTGDSMTFAPTLYIDGRRVQPASQNPTLLENDPLNEHYTYNVLMWDYGVAKRYARLIEGRFLAYWVFDQRPSGDIRIEYNQRGDFRLKLGEYAIDDDTEVMTLQQFDNYVELYDGYPVIIRDSSTFYPDAHVETTSVDGIVYGISGAGDPLVWGDMWDRAGDGHVDDGTDNAIGFKSHVNVDKWVVGNRAILLFDTSALDAADDSMTLTEDFVKQAEPLSITDYGWDYGAVHPKVLYFPDGENGYDYWMFYELVRSAVPQECITLVRSVSDGETFVDTGITNPIVEAGTAGSWDDGYIADPSAIVVDGTWYLYYNGSKADNIQAIGLSTSPDGITWTKTTSGIGGTSRVLAPTGADEANGLTSPAAYYDVSTETFYLMYAAEDTVEFNMTYKLATSPDGINFTRVGTVFGMGDPGQWDDAEVWHFDIVKYDGTFYMYYMGADTWGVDEDIGLATSSDLINWTRSAENPVITSGDYWWDDRMYKSSWMCDEHGNGYIIDGEMWFYLSTWDAGTTDYYIGLAKSWNSGTTFVVEGAELSIRIQAVGDNFAQSIYVVGTTPASNTALENADFQDFGDVKFTAATDVSDLVVDEYKALGAFNASGMDAIVKDGITKLGLRYSGDIDDDMPTWVSNIWGSTQLYFAEKGAGYKPKLIVEWSTREADAATITTSAATNVLDTSAQLNASIVNTGGDNPTITFYWGDADEAEVPGSWDFSSAPTSPSQPMGVGATYKTVGSLSSGNTYYFKARAVNTSGTSWGATQTFTTTGYPTVSTGEATSITATGATIQGTLDGLGSYATLYASFEYGDTVAYGSTTAEETMTAVGGFNASLTGLDPETTYYYRARVRYAADSYVYGAQDTFATIASVSAPGEPGVDEPDIMSIEDAKVFTSYQEANDQIILLSYKLIYNDGDPVEPASDYFTFQVLLGESIKAQVPVKMWGYRPGSVYLQPASAVPVGSDLTIKIIGRADKWDAPVPEATYSLTTAEWLGSNLADIDPWAIALAENMQVAYSTSMVIHSAEGTVLSTQGGVIFNMGIPGLAIIRPSLFSSSITYVDDGFITNEDNLQPNLEPVSRLGPYVSGMVADWGDNTFGTDLKDTWGFTVMIIFAALVVGVGLVVGFIPAIVACVPIILIGMWTGGISVAIVMVIAAIFVMFLLKSIWLRGN